MTSLTDIPLLLYIQKNHKLPEVKFEVGRKKRKLQMFYSLLSNQYSEAILKTQNLLISSETLIDIKKYLKQNDSNDRADFAINGTKLLTLTIFNYGSAETFLFVITHVNEQIVLDILNYSDIALTSWLGGIIQNSSEVHISVRHNLTEDESINLLNLFNFIHQLINLKDFERILCTSHPENFINSSKGLTSDLLVINLSNIREYIVPKTFRKEHFRWQFCGVGRTILKQVTVRSSVVKEYTRRGKRIK